MTAREHMEKHLRKLASGGVAWDRGIFSKRLAQDAVELIDVAVDIAWDILMPGSVLERPALDVYSRDGLLVFQLKMEAPDKILSRAA